MALCIHAISLRPYYSVMKSNYEEESLSNSVAYAMTERIRFYPARCHMMTKVDACLLNVFVQPVNS